MKTCARNLIGALALLALSTLNPQLSTCFAQGSLTPPSGPPGPTMTSLSQVMTTLNQNEPRRPIPGAPFYIVQPGSYYLTTNLTVTSGDAIDIEASGVTLDLNGFTISSTSQFESGTAIYISFIGVGGYTGFTDITISNGHITGGVTNKAGVYEGPGFGSGISYFQAPPVPPYNVRVTGVTVSGCANSGINVGTGNSTVVESCAVNSVGGYGIVASSVSHSTASLCGNIAIAADTASDCYGYCTGPAEGLYVTFNANNCYGSSGNGGVGIYVQGNANNCYGNCSGSGDGLYAGKSAENCYGNSSSGAGIFVYSGNANNCYGNSTSGTGLFAGANAINCYGNSGGAGDGLDATTANNCYGYSTGSGYGLNVSQTASGCYGYSGGNGNGVQAGVANTCSGYANGSGDGISTSTAFNCNGSSVSGYGLYVTNNAENCSGTSSSGAGLGNGLYAGINANNCNGYCNTGLGYGLFAINANNCYGFSLAGTGIVAGNVATGCDGVSESGIGLSAGIAIGCVSSSGDGHINNKYNMP
jgi:hypothetical protein